MARERFTTLQNRLDLTRGQLTNAVSIAEKTDRIESSIEQLEAGDVSLELAIDLKAGGDELLWELVAELELTDSKRRREGSVVLCSAVRGGTERGTALVRAVVASATPLRAQRGDVAARPPAPWGCHNVMDRHRPRHRTHLHRSVAVGLYRCSPNYTSRPTSSSPSIHLVGCPPPPRASTTQSFPGHCSVVSAA
jgi:exonuclease VII small subunit